MDAQAEDEKVVNKIEKKKTRAQAKEAKANTDVAGESAKGSSKVTKSKKKDEKDKVTDKPEKQQQKRKGGPQAADGAEEASKADKAPAAKRPRDRPDGEVLSEAQEKRREKAEESWQRLKCRNIADLEMPPTQGNRVSFTVYIRL